MDATSSTRLHAQALDDECGSVWREGFTTVDDVVEVPLESYYAGVRHPDTDIGRRDGRIMDGDLVVGGGQGRSKSVAGLGTPCGGCGRLAYLESQSIQRLEQTRKRRLGWQKPRFCYFGWYDGGLQPSQTLFAISFWR